MTTPHIVRRLAESVPSSRAGEMSEMERARRVEQLGREIAAWSTELNRHPGDMEAPE